MASVQLHATWAMYSTGAGLNGDFYAHADAVAGSGFEAARVDVSWSESQPTRGKLPTESTPVMRRVAAALNYLDELGLRAFLTLWRAPMWAHPADKSSVNVFPDAAHLPDWQAWITRVVDLFGGHPALLGVEVWNEPDLDAMSGAGADNAAAYAPVLSAAYDGVLASMCPDTPVVFGGPVAADWHYIEQVINEVKAANGGVCDKYDILAYHPYPGNWKHRFDSYDYTGVSRDPAGAWTQFRSAGGIDGATWTGSKCVADSGSACSIKAVRSRHGDTRPMWATEWGTSRAVDAGTVSKQRSITTEGVPGTWATVDDKWADFYVQAFEWLRWHSPDTTLLNCYTAWRPTSPAAGGSLSTDGMRLLNADGSLTAAAIALRSYFAENPTHRDPYGTPVPCDAAPRTFIESAVTLTGQSRLTVTGALIAGGTAAQATRGEGR